MKNRFLISGVVLLISLFLIIHSCKKDKIIPTVITTASVIEIAQTTATSGGDLIEISGSSILSKGVCWSTSPDPTIDNSKTTESGTLGAFISKLSQLTPDTKYYVRAYAISNVITGYGNQISFTTSQAVAPVLTTAAITSITQTSAVSGGLITDDGGAAITARGVCWNTSSDPTTANNKTSDEVFPPGSGGTGTGSFISNLTNLQAGTKYYVRSYAVNSLGTAYGNELEFNTSAELPGVPTLTTTAITCSSATTAGSGGNITRDGGLAITARGVCWSTTTNPTIANFKTTDGSGTGTFISSLTGLSGNTRYYVRAYATNGSGTGYGNELFFTTSPGAVVVPTLTTTVVTAITESTASSGGTISSNGGGAIIANGVCWGTADNPTTAGNKTSDGTGNASFTSNITGLTPNTTYYVRAYATSSAGTGYGTSLTFKSAEASGLTVTDPDGNVYHTVAVGAQVWMVENLRSTKLNDNTAIPLVTDATAWGDLETPGYCFPGNDANNKATYGMLYNWYAVNTGKLCPTGWHVPTDAEWTALTTNLGGESVAGGKLKEAGMTHWQTPNEGATNESGFTAVPGGERWFDGTFGSIGVGGYWWSSTQHSESFSWYRFMYYLLAYVDRDYHGKEYGHSIRCIQGVGKVIPIVTTSDVTDITSTTARGGGNVSSDGGATVTAYGVCWSTTIRPTTADNKTNDGTGTGIFTSNMTGLDAETKYYVRAYAINSEGTTYGAETSFTTSEESVATISTTAASSVTQTTATTGGNITSDGGTDISARGVCWSMSHSPSVTGSHTNEGTGTGVFVSNLSGLSGNTTYYVRAYATNDSGTAYGNEISFTTGPSVPTITTTEISSITTTTAKGGGNITNNGGSALTARGICWSISHNPTTLNSKTNDGTATGVFVSSLTGLTAGTTYYVRAYATNSTGTAYGNELGFTTTQTLVVIHTSAGSVAPVDKTVTYQTAFTSLSGTNKLWITQNLGASNQAASVGDNTENAAGWYWQFNKKQGYKNDGTTRTPATAWITSINEDSEWSAANDPCTILLGAGWRIPTSTEWNNADDNGGWTNYNQTFGSVLKIHAAGFLWPVTGDRMSAGDQGGSWSSTQVGSTSGSRLEIGSSYSIISSLSKETGLTIRCIKD